MIIALANAIESTAYVAILLIYMSCASFLFDASFRSEISFGGERAAEK